MKERVEDEIRLQDNHRVQMFDKTGKFLGKFGSIGHGDGQFNSPLFIAVKRMSHEVNHYPFRDYSYLHRSS